MTWKAAIDVVKDVENESEYAYAYAQKVNKAKEELETDDHSDKGQKKIEKIPKKIHKMMIEKTKEKLTTDKEEEDIQIGEEEADAGE